MFMSCKSCCMWWLLFWYMHYQSHVTNTPILDGKQFASMKEKRGYAAGITYKNKFHVFGGLWWLKHQRQLSSLA